MEINSADNGNGWVEVQTLGTVGLTGEGIVNRDGIGAVVFFTPEGGQTAMEPILGGSSFISQNSLAANFGLGSETRGTVEVLWPGGVRNRLYNVEAGEKIYFPEIPVSFDDNDKSLREYVMEVRDALDQLVASEVLTPSDRSRFLFSAIKAFQEDNGNSRLDVNGWVEVQTLGTVGLTGEGIVNRDGIGAVVFFTPEGGQTAMEPILGGSSFISQNSLAANFGLGSETRGTVEVLWPGGVSNRLYNVEAGEKIYFPEIPVSFDDNDKSLREYVMEVRNALEQLVASEVLTPSDRSRFLFSAISGFQEDNGNSQLDVQIGSSGRDVLTGGGVRRAFLYGGDGDDLLNGNAASRAHLDGGNGRDTFVILPGRGQAIIHFFEDGMDSLGLVGLSFSELEIVPRGSATTINMASTGVTLATLLGIDSTLISEADFS